MSMLKNVFAFGLISFFLYACKKSETGCTTDFGNPSAAEVTRVNNYVTTNGITAIEDPKGFFYRTVFGGIGTLPPMVSDSVTIKYKGSLIDGTIFDSTATGETRKFPLSRLITGWQVGLPLIRKGGIIDLYLPPSHGYGCNGQGAIPGNAITIFHIELIDF